MHCSLDKKKVLKEFLFVLFWQSPYATQAGFEFLFFLFQPPKCWDCNCVSSQFSCLGGFGEQKIQTIK